MMTFIILCMCCPIQQNETVDSLNRLRDAEFAKANPDYIGRINLAVRYERIGATEQAMALLDRKEPSDPADQSTELPVFRKMTQPEARARALDKMVYLRVQRKNINGAIELLGLMKADWNRLASLPGYAEFDPISERKLWATIYIVSQLARDGETDRAMEVLKIVGLPKYRDQVRKEAIQGLVRSDRALLAAPWVRSIEGLAYKHQLVQVGQALAEAGETVAAIDFAEYSRTRHKNDAAAMQILLAAAVAETKADHKDQAEELISKARSLFNRLLDDEEVQHLKYRKGIAGIEWVGLGVNAAAYERRTPSGGRVAQNFSRGLLMAGRTREAVRVAGQSVSITTNICGQPEPSHLILDVMKDHLAASEFKEAERVVEHFTRPLERNFARVLLANRLLTDHKEEKQRARQLADWARDWLVAAKPVRGWDMYGPSPYSVAANLLKFYRNEAIDSKEDIEKLKSEFKDRPWFSDLDQAAAPAPTEYKVNVGFGSKPLELPETPEVRK